MACNVPWPDIWETSGLQLLLLHKQTDGIGSIVSPVKFGSLFHGSLSEQVFFSQPVEDGEGSRPSAFRRVLIRVSRLSTKMTPTCGCAHSLFVKAAVLHYIAREWRMLPCWVLGYEAILSSFESLQMFG